MVHFNKGPEDQEENRETVREGLQSEGLFPSMQDQRLPPNTTERQ